MIDNQVALGLTGHRTTYHRQLRSLPRDKDTAITIKNFPHLNTSLSYRFEFQVHDILEQHLLYYFTGERVVVWAALRAGSGHHRPCWRGFWKALAMLLGVAEQISSSEASELLFKGQRLPSQLSQWPQSNSSCSLHCISGSSGEKRQQCQLMLAVSEDKSTPGVECVRPFVMMDVRLKVLSVCAVWC